MASTSSTSVQVLMNKGKRGAAAYIHAECSNRAMGSGCPRHLNELLDILLNPSKAIDDWETIDWCKWLMAGGRTPDEFVNTGSYISTFTFARVFLLFSLGTLTSSVMYFDAIPSSIMKLLFSNFLYQNKHFFSRTIVYPYKDTLDNLNYCAVEPNVFIVGDSNL